MNVPSFTPIDFNLIFRQFRGCKKPAPGLALHVLHVGFVAVLEDMTGYTYTPVTSTASVLCTGALSASSTPREAHDRHDGVQVQPLVLRSVCFASIPTTTERRNTSRKAKGNGDYDAIS
jgi:hypothetical protein